MYLSAANTLIPPSSKMILHFSEARATSGEIKMKLRTCDREMKTEEECGKSSSQVQFLLSNNCIEFRPSTREVLFACRVLCAPRDIRKYTGFDMF